MELQKNKETFDKHNIGILAASVDPVDKAGAMAERTGATFTILSDEKGQLIEYFNIWNRRRPEKTDISIASSFLFTQKGDLIWQNITDNYKIRPKPEEILAAAETYNKTVKKQE